MTADPDVVTARAGLAIPGLTPPVYRIYPVVDHIADKVCATEELTAGRPSSRARDLVDLVVFARTQTIDGTALIEAIIAERHHRDLPAAADLAIPPDWARPYPKLATQTSHCTGLSFAEACLLAKKLVDPAIDQSASGRLWSPEPGEWLNADADDRTLP